MPDLKQLVERVESQETLTDLLEGLDWPVAPEFAFQEYPDIADGLTSEGAVRIYRLIPPSLEDDHLVVLAEFEQPYVRRDLRDLLRSLRLYIRKSGHFENHTGIGDTVFIVAAPLVAGRNPYEEVRFVHFEERDKGEPYIRSFGWHSHFVGRTVLTHNLERLRWSSRDDWKPAWDIEGLTEEFYKEFERVFYAFKGLIKYPGDETLKHAFAQTLFNRLLFLAFAERRRWLVAPNGSTDYLHTLWLNIYRLHRMRKNLRAQPVPPVAAASRMHCELRLADLCAYFVLQQSSPNGQVFRAGAQNAIEIVANLNLLPSGNEGVRVVWL